MTNSSSPVPVKFILHKKSRTLEIHFDSHETFVLPCAYLRAYSSSAEMKLDEKNAVKKDFSAVNILSIEPVGQYAIKPVFSDGHRTGIYSWGMLYDLCLHQKTRWPSD